MLRIIATGLALTLAMACTANAALMTVTYDFTGGSYAPTSSGPPIVTGTNVNDVNLSQTLSQPGSIDKYFLPYSTTPNQSLVGPKFGYGLGAGGVPTNTPTDTKYFFMTLQVGTQAFDLTGLNFDFARNSPGGDFRIYASKDGFASTYQLVLDAENYPANINMIDLTEPQYSSYFQNLTTDITFRFYVRDNGSNSNSVGMSFDNIAFEVATVPEPSSMIAWAGLAGFGAVLRYRRKLVL